MTISSDDNETAAGRLKLLTYNIHGCMGRWGGEHAERVLEVIRSSEADVIALQEVQDDDEEDRSFLTALMGLNYASVIYGPTFRKSKGRFGNILMTRWPVTEMEKIDISASQGEPRGAIRAKININSATLEILATHLGLGIRERRLQLGLLEKALPGWNNDTKGVIRIAMGDFNEWIPKGKNRRILTRFFGKTPKVTTFPSFIPIMALDRIYVRPASALINLKALRTGPAKDASDHLPLMAEISLKT